MIEIYRHQILILEGLILTVYVFFMENFRVVIKQDRTASEECLFSEIVRRIKYVFDKVSVAYLIC